MLTNEEKEFLVYWKENREREKKISYQLLKGLPFGIIPAIAIFIALRSGWYTRAEMVANTELNPYLFLFALMGIIIFTAVFYKKVQWEMKEQRYKELLSKQKKELQSPAHEEKYTKSE